MWQTFLTISILSIAISSILQRILLQDESSEPKVYAIVFQFIKGVLVSLFLLGSNISFAEIIKEIFVVWPHLMITGILYGAGTLSLFEGFKRLQASEATVLFASRALWAILAALFFLNESFIFRQYIGLVMILLSVILIAGKSSLMRITVGHLYMFFASALYGIAFVNDAYIVTRMSPLVYTAIGSFIVSGVLFAFFPQTVTKLAPFLKGKLLIKLVLLSGTFGISSVTLYYAYVYGRNAGEIASIYQTSTVVTVLFAIIFLKETSQIAKKVVGAFLSMCGVLLVK